MKKKQIALLCVLILSGTMLAATLSSCSVRLHDKYWVAEQTSGYATIRGLTAAGREQTELTLPAEIKGYPVKKLEANRTFIAAMLGSDIAHANLGKLRKMTIEGSVEITRGFFGNSGVEVIEFLSEKPSILKEGIFEGNRRWAAFLIVPEGSPDDFFGEGTENRLKFKPLEAINGYFIKENIFHGYYGDKEHIEVPEGVESTAVNSGVGYSVTTIKFPSTMKVIIARSNFNASNGLETVYVSQNTVIEEGAISSHVEIVRY
ncbi:MAG: hypothetical protein LBQ27_04415 [Clostridiales bacterium]|nr:hypothetical protein [Clostridiales bacterium]